MALTIASAGWLYAACVMLHQAHPRRSELQWVARHAKAPALLRTGAAILMMLALCGLAHINGWERAIPIAIGLLALAGVGNVLIATYWRSAHIASGALALLLSGIAIAVQWLA